MNRYLMKSTRSGQGCSNNFGTFWSWTTWVAHELLYNASRTYLHLDTLNNMFCSFYGAIVGFISSHKPLK